MLGLNRVERGKLEVQQEGITIDAGVGHGRNSGSDRRSGSGGAGGGEGERGGSSGALEAEGEGGGPERARERLLGERKMIPCVTMQTRTMMVYGARDSDAGRGSHEREHVDYNKERGRRR